jgi:hypothetical protein
VANDDKGEDEEEEPTGGTESAKGISILHKKHSNNTIASVIVFNTSYNMTATQDL